MLVGIVSTPDTLILNACGVGSTVGVFFIKTYVKYVIFY